MRLALALAIAVAAACSSKPGRDAQVQGGSTMPPTQATDAAAPTAPASPDAPPASIGAATMKPDGTLLLQLRAEGPGGLEGDALLVYPPSHPRYAKVLAHLGGLTPGESKPVPPWPDPPDAGKPAP